MTEEHVENSVLLPEVLSIEEEGNKQCLTLKMPANLHYFEGHFDQAKILPGVVQIKWAVHFGKTLFKLAGVFKRLEVIKFQQVIVPKSEVILELANSPDASKLYFTYRVSEDKASSGRIVFGEQSNGS